MVLHVLHNVNTQCNILHCVTEDVLMATPDFKDQRLQSKPDLKRQIPLILIHFCALENTVLIRRVKLLLH